MITFTEKTRPQGTSVGVKTMLGDPKKAVRKMSVPLIVSMLLVSIYNLADAAWVAGLGADALAGVGFITPIFLVLVGLGNGLGAGATSAISRYIGENNKEKADNGSVHTIIITVILSIIVSVILLALQEPILVAMGAGKTIGYAEQYGTVMFTGAILFILPNAMYGILRAEGDVTRTMYAMAISGILNIILDPIFIYTLNLGVAGAAYATLISVGIVIIILAYWFYGKKDTYLKPFWSNYKYSKEITSDILGVGLPASLEMLLTAIFAALFSALLTVVANTDAVAVYSTGWRVVSIGTMPVIGISTALVSIIGANLGATRYENIRIAHRYSIKLSILAAIITGVLVYVFAPQIIMLFSYSSNSAYLAPKMVEFLRCMVLFYVFMAIGAPSTFAFQGVGKGVTSMFQTLLRQLLLTIVFAYLFAIPFGWGEYGAWWGIIAGEFVACIITFVWANGYIKRLIKSKQ